MLLLIVSFEVKEKSLEEAMEYVSSIVYESIIC